MRRCEGNSPCSSEDAGVQASVSVAQGRRAGAWQVGLTGACNSRCGVRTLHQDLLCLFPYTRPARMNGLSLFSGIGGLDLALRGFVHTRMYCETDDRCAAVLRARMRSGDLPHGPVHGDVRTLGREEIESGFARAPIDAVFAGFPCQDLSTAGARRGLDGVRSGLFWEILRIVRELPRRPRFLFLENVAGIRSIALDRVGTALAGAGYDCRWATLRVSALGGHHRRARWFCLARLRRPLALADAQVGHLPPRVLELLQQAQHLHAHDRLRIAHPRLEARAQHPGERLVAPPPHHRAVLVHEDRVALAGHEAHALPVRRARGVGRLHEPLEHLHLGESSHRSRG
ncbi:MAG: hypothetical protein EOP01_00305 [Propionibacteriaceae bacterium]|nr:MAG: hypothetical protein EOP01_00305 [Propionibacteriaceae bacterium]